MKHFTFRIEASFKYLICNAHKWVFRSVVSSAEALNEIWKARFFFHWPTTTACLDICNDTLKKLTNRKFYVSIGFPFPYSVTLADSNLRHFIFEEKDKFFRFSQIPLPDLFFIVSKYVFFNKWALTLVFSISVHNFTISDENQCEL